MPARTRRPGLHPLIFLPLYTIRPESSRRAPKMVFSSSILSGTDQPADADDPHRGAL